jgi:hypothetical protein
MYRITVYLLFVEEMWIAGHNPIILLCGKKECTSYRLNAANNIK